MHIHFLTVDKYSIDAATLSFYPENLEELLVKLDPRRKVGTKRPFSSQRRPNEQVQII